MNPLNDLGPFLRWFEGFCNSYRTEDPADQRNLDLKELHTHKVLEGARLIAAGGGERRLFLAEIAALCHDLGRFPQYRQYRTFRDSDSVNHAHLSAQILHDSGLLQDFPDEEAKSILTAVRLHNILEVPGGLDAQEEDLLKVVRDADKLDIWRVFIDYHGTPDDEKPSAVSLGVSDRPECSPEVIAALGTGAVVRLATLKTLNDFTLLQLSWLYDINFDVTLTLVRERGIVETLSSTLPRSPQLAEALDAVQRYIDRRLSGKIPHQVA